MQVCHQKTWRPEEKKKIVKYFSSAERKEWTLWAHNPLPRENIHQE